MSNRNDNGLHLLVMHARVLVDAEDVTIHYSPSTGHTRSIDDADLSERTRTICSRLRRFAWRLNTLLPVVTSSTFGVAS